MTLSRSHAVPLLHSSANQSHKALPRPRLEYTLDVSADFSHISRSGDQLKQRMNAMNISTSFINESDSENSDPSPARPSIRQAHIPFVPARGQAAMTRESSSQVSMAQLLPEPTAEGKSAERTDTRESLLELVGMMLDSNLLSEEETMHALEFAMRQDTTFQLMCCLVNARNSLATQATFLRLWLKSQLRPTSGPVEYRPDVQSMNVPIVRPRPLQRSSSRRQLELVPMKPSVPLHVPAPVPSPPLMPTSLQFSDGSPNESGDEWCDRGPTPSILLSNPRHTLAYNKLMKPFAVSCSVATPSTGSPSLDMGVIDGA